MYVLTVLTRDLVLSMLQDYAPTNLGDLLWNANATFNKSVDSSDSKAGADLILQEIRGLAQKFFVCTIVRPKNWCFFKCYGATAFKLSPP